MGIPLHSEVQSVTTGYVFKAVYSLPIKADDWRPYFFLNNNKIRRDVSSSMSDNNSSHLLIDHLTGQKYEHFDVEAKEIERKLIDNDEEENDEDDEDDDEPEENDGNFYWNANQPLPKDKQPLPVNSRWNFYKGLEAIGDKYEFGIYTMCNLPDFNSSSYFYTVVVLLDDHVYYVQFVNQHQHHLIIKVDYLVNFFILF